MSILCPICGKDDAIQKVTSIISSGTHTGTSTGMSAGGGFVDGKFDPMTGISSQDISLISNLSYRLISAYPKEPSKSGACINIILAFFISAPLISSGLQFFLINYNNVIKNAKNFWNNIGDFFSSMALSIIGVGIIILGIYIIIIFISIIKRTNEKYKRDMENYYIRLRNFNELYYCFRHDIVFIPWVDRYVTPENLQSLL